jgi:hypothetical protein
VKGTDFNPPKLRHGSFAERGWGARLIPAHCHPRLVDSRLDGALQGSTRLERVTPPSIPIIRL